ncbi:PRD domain-containing protein [Streptococcus pasteurianus]|uniref:PRD domain-containing protein n=1 Tax=Streptococcus pasteurianus TaxID=197614 RepID=UPI0010A7A7D6|nr:PRD domain-containing protein [Streptococcus pasteurianus]MDV5118435.1 PRD domain-containing protein [Streptococcus pasteurianus]MDV5124731.1 PRD domain-containing protein [Streptococcus pasteurianus]MDV5152683.1 PRD domain-containing protein [Streptococcus pasteurianus]QCE37193.1 PRD domain-containing protein [Streptococcus pasteurianus]
MKTNKEKIYDYLMTDVYETGKIAVVTQEIAEVFGLQRSNASSLLNELVKEGRLVKQSGRPVKYIINDHFESQNKQFPKMIGDDGSLSKAIQLAKAAILYPKENINVLIISEMGTGKTELVRNMYAFATSNHVLGVDSPYIEFNCHHFKKEMQTLVNELFGSRLEDSLFAKADNGLLFIDNADILPAKEQSRLFKLLETKRLYSEDMTDYIDCQHLKLILGISGDIDNQFNQHVNMIINLPSLDERSVEEKYNIMLSLFKEEAARANRRIEVSKEVLSQLLLAHFEFNIKELGYQLTSACATAYLRVIDNEKPIKVNSNDLVLRDNQKLIRELSYRQKVLNLLEDVDYVSFLPEGDSYLTRHNIYHKLDKKFQEMGDVSQADSLLKEVHSHIGKILSKYFKGSEDGLAQLSKIVDNRLITTVSDFLQQHHIELERSRFYGLCLHVNALLKDNHNQQQLSQERYVEMIKNYPEEYLHANQLGKVLESDFHLDLSFEETIILAAFFINEEMVTPVSKTVLLYILHGEGTATSLAETTKTLTQANNVYGYDLQLNQDISDVRDDLKDYIANIHQGKGLIVIYDMGSIKSMLNEIALQLNIKIRRLEVPITMLGIDIARRLQMENDIDDVFHDTALEWNRYANKEHKERIIITLCHTGEGGALQMKQVIDKNSRLGYKVIPLAISDRDLLNQEVYSLKKAYYIHCFVGTYDPRMLGIPFIPLRSVFDNGIDNIDATLTFSPIATNRANYDPIYENLAENLKYTPIDKIKTYLPDFINQLELIYTLSEDQQVGLLMHISAMINRLRSPNLTDVNYKIDTDYFLQHFKDDYKSIRRMLKNLEKHFNIIISDDEVALLIQIIRQI